MKKENKKLIARILRAVANELDDSPRMEKVKPKRCRHDKSEAEKIRLDCAEALQLNPNGIHIQELVSETLGWENNTLNQNRLSGNLLGDKEKRFKAVGKGIYQFVGTRE